MLEKWQLKKFSLPKIVEIREGVGGGSPAAVVVCLFVVCGSFHCTTRCTKVNVSWDPQSCVVNKRTQKVKATGRKNALANGREEEGGERNRERETRVTEERCVCGMEENFQSVKKYLNPTLMKNFLHNP